MKTLIIAASYLALVNAQSPPVFTLGSPSDYIKPPAATATPRNHEISILPKNLGGGVPEDGIDVFFGSDLQGAIKSVLSSDACKAEGVSSDCSTAVGKAIDAQHALTVEKRIVGIDDVVLLAGAGLALMIGVIVEWSKQESPQHVHIPAGDLAAIQSHTDGNIAVATASGATPVTISVTPTPEPSVGSVSILTADDGEHKSGDAAVTLPSGMADLIDQLIMKSPDAGECLSDGAQNGKRALRTAKPLTPGLLESIRRVVEFALSSAGNEGLLEDVNLVADGAILPTITDPGVVAAMEQSRQYAAQLESFSGKAQEFIDERSNELFFTVWAYCSYGLGAQGISPVYVPPSHKAAEDGENDDDDDDKCPSDLECADDSCKGQDGKCTAEGTNKDCDCSSDNGTAKMVKHIGGDKETLDWYSAMLQQMLGESESNDDPGRTPHMLDDRPSDMTGDDFKALAKDQLCDNLMRRVESGESNQYSMYPNGVSLSINRDGLDGEAKWGCKISEAQTCENALDDMANGDSGRRGDGGKWMAAKITKDSGCGNITINFPDCSNCKEPEVEPTPPTMEDNPINNPNKPPVIIEGNSQCANDGDDLASSMGMEPIIKQLQEKGGACELDGSAGKNGDDECTELGKNETNGEALGLGVIADARLRFCAPAGNNGYYMQCSSLAAEAQQFVNDCVGSGKFGYFGGRKYVNGDGFYLLATQ